MSLPFRFKFPVLLSVLALLAAPVPWVGPAHARDTGFDATCVAARQGRGQRVVCADMVALDQMLVYNRFGSFNPYGMIFALRRDVVAMGGDGAARPADCATDTGTQPTPPGPLQAGQVRLRDCRRPRPLVLRANVGDLLFLRVQNLLAPEVPGNPPARTLSRDFCPGGEDPVGAHISRGPASMVDHGEALCRDRAPSADGGAILEGGDWPRTRTLNLLAEGLMPLALPGQDAPDPACLGLDAVPPQGEFRCLYEVVQEGTHFFASRAAPAGGEGDGGSITHGLFGAVMAERPGTRWYRSQVSQAALDAAWPARADGPRHARTGAPDYEKALDGVPVLNMARPLGTADFRAADAVELVHADLNAIIWCDHGARPPGGYDDPPLGCADDTMTPDRTEEPRFDAFREFSVFFHDELKTFYTRNFEELARFGQLAGVRDGFAINYGASGMGTMLLANRKGIGPAAACAECLYEEFFLTSWANGDPALLEWYADDPSNVHHSYLNDPVVFRNFHAGPKETHVFHLHAHQWFAGNDHGRGSYLDSQTVAPGQGFTYNIYHGGRGREKGAWYVGGSGNRNRTVGDSIFHCHLYPHFAQGMWALWRVHDVFEDGTRKLPDGQAQPGLSADIRAPGEARFIRPGSVDPKTGAWSGGAGTPVPALVPLPGEALPPLPTYAAGGDGAALSPGHAFPTGGPERLIRAQASAPAPANDAPAADAPADAVPDAMPGYPFYVAGQAGHRPPQAPGDIARAVDGDGAPAGSYLSGGLGRHVITGAARELPLNLPPAILQRDADLAAALDQGDNRARLETLRSQIVAKALALGDMMAHLGHADIRLLDPEGEPLERAAQAFHYNGAGLTVRAPDGQPVTPANGSYPTPRAPLPGSTAMEPGAFQVNGAPPAPGAPYADPCGGARGREGEATGTDPLTGRAGYIIDPNLNGFRRYKVSAVQLDLVVNGAGWHDPQARIDVLTGTSDDFKLADDRGDRISPTTRDDVQPFFFRALSGECIEFRHTNELPKELDLDDFQVRTPTDTIGQHIHLVKFDVTSSDGSGNGWNYEDGTFAPDELMARRCAALRGGGMTPSRAGADPGAWGARPATAAECAALNNGRVWRLPLSAHRDLFQTTVQRWFADPIMTLDGADDPRDPDDRPEPQDRTMRTVFSHDHFGPSSIQQHGFYTALLVEPAGARICDPHEQGSCTAQVGPDPWALRDGTPEWIGAQKIVKAGGRDDPTHPDYREFALSIADFAVLYDPRDRDTPQAVEPAPGSDHSGMARLYCEARQAAGAASAAATSDQCGEAEAEAGEPDTAPAWWAAGAPGDLPFHRARLHGSLMGDADALRLRDHLVYYRGRAASPDGRPIGNGTLAKPVAPPVRPESISVDHHDPYLVSYRNAPLPLRLGTDRADGSPSSDCAALGMTRWGTAAASPSEVVGRLMAGTMPRCSHRYQLAGERGDAGHVLSSWMPGDASAPRRDPETPQFEAYQNERILFRLIQGAQEVQHVFNLAGIAGPRNIDQRFPQGMRDLAVTVDPARAACFRAMRDTRPEEYDEWLNLTPKAREDYDETNTEDAEALARFDAFDRALANCDNAEGYTFAQEVGISEHFEIRGRLRSDVISMERRREDAALRAAAPQPGVTEASDYLYNFGTLDSLWNGAWGLVRIYMGQPERAALLARWGDRAAPETLVAVDNASATPTEMASRRAEAPSPNDALGCPLPTNGLPGHETAGLVVALRTADAWPGGTDYGGHRRDPDGLMLALLNPDRLPGARRDMRDNGDWQDLRRSDVLSAVRAAYARPEPFVMRVNAGDCVVLRYVNLLQDGPGGGLPDGLGDALMPKIAPLNVDPVPQVTRRTDANGTRVTGTLTPTTRPASGLRPSARLGLSVGLPGGDLIRNLPLGYGINSPAMPPASRQFAEVSGELRFYAGRMRINLPEGGSNPHDSVAADAVIAARDKLDQWAGPGPSWSARRAAGSDPVHFTVLGVGYTIPGAMLDQGQQDRMQLFAQAELQRHIHWIPYAFGPVPLRVTGDVVSQTVHGLFGVIDVVPRGWTIPAPLQTPMQTPASDGERLMQMVDLGLADSPVAAARPWRGAAVPGGFGASALFRDVRLDPDGTDQPVDIREFILFYQDGLNHHDTQSSIRWRWDDGRTEAARIVPDCPICDDSYDRGDQGVSYRSRPFASLLRFADIAGRGRIEASDDLNAVTFPPRFFAGQSTHGSGRPTGPDRQPLVLMACPGEQVLIRVVHPGGRARQRAFIMNGLGYDDLFPGFGFPNSALVAPGKAVSAWLHPPTVIGPDGQRRPVEGKVLWHDGPAFLMAGGTWGLVEFSDSACEGDGR
ncbi:hypothetical protein [Paracoccus shandongensis]|uniref:hypothetical protein n=1 Tax=Paracoccus shandongensis TaxID=2816048 RepID=UPI001A8C33FB|nr:hypothetical protein [Paracoccus shandongensis]